MGSLSECRETSILFFDNSAHIAQAAILLSKNFPVAAGVERQGNRIYGFFGFPVAFTSSRSGFASIQVLKSQGEAQRDFYERPPVAITPWEKIEMAVDWRQLTDNNKIEEIVRIQKSVKQLFAKAYLILPIKSQYEDKLPFAKKDSNGFKYHAFLLCFDGFPLESLITAAENLRPEDFLLTTSANLHNQPTCGTYEEILNFTRGNLHTVLIESEIEPPEETGLSGSIYKLGANFPNEIEVVRLRSRSRHDNFVNLAQSLFPGVEFNFSTLDKILSSDRIILE